MKTWFGLAALFAGGAMWIAVGVCGHLHQRSLPADRREELLEVDVPEPARRTAPAGRGR